MKTSVNFFKSRILFAFTALSMVAAISSCEKEDDTTSDPDLKSVTYSYEFNNGQTVATAPYDSTHPGNLTAEMKVEEMMGGGSKITITLMNTIDGENYMVHAHDAANPANTPNGTPYNETPNADILVQTVVGNGGSAMASQETSMSYDELTATYDGFFVVHDPLQPINTADISTYLVVGAFAREQTPTGFKSKTYNYNFNTGQVAAMFAYAGTHTADLSARITITELAAGNSRVYVTLMNTMAGEVYPTHSHDKADPTTTPNNTPYNETPNVDVMVQNIMGTGGMAHGEQLSTKSYAELTGSYEAFFVIHDPLQAMTTVDPTTYLILGDFARE